MEQELRQSQKMEAIGQMAGGIVHEFRNLLMVVNGCIEQLDTELLTDKSRRLLGHIRTATQHGEKLTRQVLSFCQGRPQKPEVIYLTQLFEDISEILRHSLRSNIQIKVDLPSTPCSVEADPDELYLAILNLAVNARDAMVRGGTFTVAIAPVEINRAEFIAISFADTGIGIPPEHLPHVFDPHFTTKKHGNGAGLGLSQVYGFARQAGGQATISSALQIGTTVTIYLPSAKMSGREYEGPKS